MFPEHALGAALLGPPLANKSRRMGAGKLPETPIVPDQSAKERPIRTTFAILGIVVATLSLISLIQRLTSTPLSEFAAEIVAYYRLIAGQLKGVLFDWWLTWLWPNLVFPAWAMDAINVWVLCLAAIWRMDLAERGRTRLGAGDIALRVMLAPVFLLLSILVVAIGSVYLTPYNDPNWSFRRDGRAAIKAMQSAEARRHSRAIALWVAALSPIVGTFAFFVWNALML